MRVRVLYIRKANQMPDYALVSPGERRYRELGRPTDSWQAAELESLRTRIEKLEENIAALTLLASQTSRYLADHLGYLSKRKSQSD